MKCRSCKREFLLSQKDKDKFKLKNSYILCAGLKHIVINEVEKTKCQEIENQK